MKLHLGCGQRYFDGYINIDYPLTEHSVQQSSVADELTNLLELRYAKDSIDEVRLHHVFEHFSRADAMALLASWNTWLKTNGTLHIEVPDFERTAKAVLSLWSNEKAKYVGLRHIFGSQEAHWAVHYEGYTKTILKELLLSFGFQVRKVVQTKYRDTYNLEVIAQKEKSLSKDDSYRAAESLFKKYMVADVESENELLRIWLNDFANRYEKTKAS